MSSILEKALVSLDKSEDHSHEVAHLLAVVSTWTYSDLVTFEDVLLRPGVGFDRRPTKVDEFRVTNPALLTDAHGYLVSHEITANRRLHILTFRGTEITSTVDLLTDAIVTGHDWNEGEDEAEDVHRGFFLSLDVLWPQIVESLNKVLDHKNRQREDRLLITGHSLGGAIGVLAARRFCDEESEFGNLKLEGVYTFGQPMVGEPRFNDNCTFIDRYHRYVYNEDLVPRLPPKTSKGVDYAHLGKSYYHAQPGGNWSEKKDEAIRCEQDDLLHTFLAYLTTRMPVLGFLHKGLETILTISDPISTIKEAFEKFGEKQQMYSLDDHMPSNYVAVTHKKDVESGVRRL